MHLTNFNELKQSLQTTIFKLKKAQSKILSKTLKYLKLSMFKKVAFGLSDAADDLRTFYKACENAPILDSFQSEPSFSEVLKDLDQQLFNYESKVAEFDDLIKSFEN
ncbi:autophagy-related 13 isoform X3 [Brachionus plicatilis]|uniref:Autophagy-related 13 isoform X3 n=1 Tax=Brachionus plicatilis TaxID=10195 RepID=A0A3M7RNY6_BRAPC|nr:autophagy-related 13 isoform X3 [Brachionus plicatilis]